jgi:hypothetical protein
MRVAIMQPYFLPYIGYFQLMAAVDRFVLYDNIKYTKKGWINRNQLLQGEGGAVFSIPLKAGSDALDVRERRLADGLVPQKLLDRFEGAYGKAPHWHSVKPVLSRILNFDDRNLFGFIANSLREICAYIAIETPVVVSSTLPIDHALKAQEKVLAICRHLQADCYLNTIGGRTLYDCDVFNARGIELRFLQSRLDAYPQFGQAFVPRLSIVDVLAFNSPPRAREMLEHFDLV